MKTLSKKQILTLHTALISNSGELTVFVMMVC